MKQFLEALRGLFFRPAMAATVTAAVAVGGGYEFGKRSTDVLRNVGPEIRTIAECAIVRSEVDFTVYHGQRTDAEQRDMIARGVSWVNRSRHQDGMAIDVMAYDESGKGVWEKRLDLYEKIAAAFYACGKEEGIPIAWGCEWVVRDCVHFEVKR